MNEIIIQNIGPIKDVQINLKKVNIVMGPQSSGKSTIAKLTSFCQWVEKRYILDGEFNYDFKDQFISFHRISEAYFNKDSFFKYESDFITISHNGIDFDLVIEKKDNVNYKKSKNIYIPAERNFVSVIPNLGKYNETNDNIMSFLYDWYDAKKTYGNKKNALSILNLGVKYYYNKESDLDVLKLNDSKKELLLKNASSGLQSVIPLVMLIDYLTGDFYSENKSTSINENEELVKVFIKNFNYIMDNANRRKDFQKSLNSKIEKFNLNNSEAEKMLALLANRKEYFSTSLIIEEPEQNLFPSTQRDLIYYLFDKIVNSDRPHSLFITTHSPFILYAINNCLMGSEVSSKMPKDEQVELLSYKAWLDPSLVAVWQIEDGKLNSVIDERTGTVTRHYFNEVLKGIMDEYYEMLNYFEYDNKAKS